MTITAIAIGSSFGGVEALSVIAAALPADFPAALLIVNHISPFAATNLHHILAQQGPMAASIAKDGEKLRSRHIYVASPDHHLLLNRDRLRLTTGPRENRQRPAIDALFRSCAESRGADSVGVVLTGMLDDGTAGLWAIKDRGGVAIVQLPEDAASPSMPRNAIDAVETDYILPLVQISSVLVRVAAIVACRSRVPQLV